uniref:Putative ovule protein n=1 Tax=Solanum chacoense TaxID=4108 RepID=A0A0V0GP15_SOLCH
MRFCCPMVQSWRQCDPFGCLNCSVCILLAQKLPGLNVEVIDGRVIRTPRQESFPVYHYVSV